MRLDDFDFELPKELIAQRPAKERAASRLLCVDGRNGAIADRRFRELPDLVGPADVSSSTTPGHQCAAVRRKNSGGQVEMLVERLLDQRSALVQLRASKPPRAGSAIQLVRRHDGAGPGPRGRVLPAAVRVRRPPAYLERHGSVPLPPYIEHAPDAGRRARYQTVYARAPGRGRGADRGPAFRRGDARRAAPSAASRSAYITLHVGAGTFQPVRVSDLSEPRDAQPSGSTSRSQTVDAIERARDAATAACMAVGTTTLRALESAGGAAASCAPAAAKPNSSSCRATASASSTGCVTNFHLPRSTLLMLVSRVRAAWRTSGARIATPIDERYRFFSYGDAMLIERQDGLAAAAMSSIATRRARSPIRAIAIAHFVAITTRWMDNDVYRHVNNVVYYSFFDTAVNEYMMRQRRARSRIERHRRRLVVETGCTLLRADPFSGSRALRAARGASRHEQRALRDRHLSQRRAARRGARPFRARVLRPRARSARSRCRRHCARRWSDAGRAHDWRSDAQAVG